MTMEAGECLALGDEAITAPDEIAGDPFRAREHLCHCDALLLGHPTLADD